MGHCPITSSAGCMWSRRSNLEFFEPPPPGRAGNPPLGGNWRRVIDAWSDWDLRHRSEAGRALRG
jgi:hypothetical protein